MFYHQYTNEQIKSYLADLWRKEYPQQVSFIDYILSFDWEVCKAEIQKLKCGKPHRKAKVEKYATLLSKGIQLPPLVVINGEVIDGYHRYHALKAIDFTHYDIFKLKTPTTL